jgi:hypothetical protein
MSLIQQLKRRNVIRVGIAYCVVGWLVLQMASMVAPMLGLPAWIMPVLLSIGVLGFPFILLFAWSFEITPQGLRRTEQVQPGQSIVEETRATLNKVITSLLVLALLLVLAEQYFPLLSHESAEASSSRRPGSAIQP